MIVLFTTQKRDTGFIVEQKIFHHIPDFAEYKKKVKHPIDAMYFSNLITALRKNLNGDEPYASSTIDYIYSVMIFKD